MSIILVFVSHDHFVVPVIYIVVVGIVVTIIMFPLGATRCTFYFYFIAAVFHHIVTTAVMIVIMIHIVHVCMIYFAVVTMCRFHFAMRFVATMMFTATMMAAAGLVFIAMMLSTMVMTAAMAIIVIIVILVCVEGSAFVAIHLIGFFTFLPAYFA